MKITKPEVHETPATTPPADAASNAATFDAFSYLLSQLAVPLTPLAETPEATDADGVEAATTTKTTDYPVKSADTAAPVMPTQASTSDEFETNFLNQQDTSIAMQPIDKRMPADANTLFLKPLARDQHADASSSATVASTIKQQDSTTPDEQPVPAIDANALAPLLSQWQLSQQAPVISASNGLPKQSTLIPALTDVKSAAADTKLPSVPVSTDMKSAEIFQQVTQWVNTAVALPAVQHSTETALYTVQTKAPETPPPLSHAEILPMALDNVGNEMHHAKINLYPPELGHLVATIKLDKNTAELQILTATQQVKEIVEAQLPKLHEQFQQTDIHLTHVQIDSALSGDHANQHYHANRSADDQPEFATNTMSQPQLSLEQSSTQSNNIIDTYA